jgi:hypothetical protein
MAYMRFRNELGQELFDRVAPRLDWLDGSLAVRTLRGPRRRRVEQELMAFLLLMRYGEDVVRAGRGMDMLEYLRDADRMNPACYKLLHGREPITLEFETSGGVFPAQLGYAEGLSMAAPLTRSGYEDYTRRRIWGLEFRDEHIVPPLPDGRTAASYAFLGTVFHVPALPRRLRDDGTNVVTYATPRSSARLIAQVYRQVGGFLPAIRYDGRTGRYAADLTDTDELPTIVCSTDGEIADGLVPRAGFAPCEISKVGLPMFELRLADLNDEGLDPERRGLIERTLRNLERFSANRRERD